MRLQPLRLPPAAAATAEPRLGASMQPPTATAVHRGIRLAPLATATAEHAGSCLAAALLSAALLAGPRPALAAPEVKSYDGFAEYAAQGRKMDDTDVNCLIGEKQCKDQTLACFSGQEKLGGTGDLSCLKGVVCLGQCQGEQRCATQCFAQYGSSVLDNWLSCAIEDQQCVKVPQDLDFSQINANPPPIAAGFKVTHEILKAPCALVSLSLFHL